MILNRLFRRESLSSRYFDGGHPRTDALARLFGFSQPTAAGQVVTEETAMTLSAVYAAVRILSETRSQLPLNVLRSRPDGRGSDVSAQHPAQRVLHYVANDDMTAVVFHETMEVHRLLWGNAYAEIGWDGGGNVRALWPIEPWRVTPERVEGRVVYRVDGSRPLEKADILHVPGLCFDGIVGRSVISWARESLGLSLAAQQYGSGFFRDGAVPSGIIEMEGHIRDEAAKKRFKDNWNDTHGGGKRGLAILEQGAKYKAIGIPPEDAQFLETRKFQIADVARWFNVPPHMLRDLERATFSNIEQQGIEFVMYSLQPSLIRWEQEINRKLLNPPSVYCKHVVKGLLRGDSQGRSEFYQKMVNSGVYSVNDIRALEDENPIGADGDVHFVNSTMIPIERALEPSPAPQPEQKPAPETKAEPPKKNNAALMGAMREVLADPLRRMLAKEANAAKRAAEKPREFFDWLDAFYVKHADTLREAVLPAVSAYLAAMESDRSPAMVADQLCRRHVEQSRGELLAASDGPPEQFSERVGRCVDGWRESRTQVELGANPNGYECAA